MQPAANDYELGPHKPTIYATDYSDGLDAVDANGHVPVPEDPGLGITVGCAGYSQGTGASHRSR